MRSSPRKIAVDTGALVALLSSKDPQHMLCRGVVQRLFRPVSFYSTEACLTEACFLLPADALHRRKLLQLIEGWRLDLLPMDRDGLRRCFELQDKYHDLPMDFADATIVVACEKLDIRHVFTLDHKDFSIYKPQHCKRLEIVPKV